MFLDFEGLVGVLLLFLWIYCIFDVIASDTALVRNLPKMAWFFVVLILPDVGSIAWLLLGRPAKAGWRPGDTTVREQRWTGVTRRSETPDEIASREASIAERDRLIAEWEAEEAARKQAKRDEAQARKDKENPRS